MTTTPAPTKNKIWRLKSKEERRFKQGHPWVYSNELQESPKGITAGDAIELHDASGNFLAYGFGNPGSLIAFRALTRNKDEMPTSPESSVGLFSKKIKRAFYFRSRWFSPKASCRVVFGETDDLPGLVIDRYVGEKKTVYVVQPHASGMDKHIETILQALKSAHAGSAPALAVLRRDAGSREREGLEKIPTVVISLENLQPVDDTSELTPFKFSIPGVNKDLITISADLIKGQKTGFFFDQLENIRTLNELMQRRQKIQAPKESIHILDLCTYVGQWSLQLTDTLIEQSKVSVTLVDASDSALELAEQNVSSAFPKQLDDKKLSVRRIKADVLDPIEKLASSQFDIVIADPPALIKSRKVMPQGKQAYVQLMTEAVRRTKPGGLIVACSCSQLLSNEDFIEVLGKAAKRGAPERTVRWISQGALALDHFQRFDFREGQYLKCWIGEVSAD